MAQMADMSCQDFNADQMRMLILKTAGTGHVTWAVPNLGCSRQNSLTTLKLINLKIGLKKWTIFTEVRNTCAMTCSQVT